MRQLWRRVDAAVATRRHRPLLVQRVRPLQQDERLQSTHQAAQANRKFPSLDLSLSPCVSLYIDSCSILLLFSCLCLIFVVVVLFGVRRRRCWCLQISRRIGRARASSVPTVTRPSRLCGVATTMASRCATRAASTTSCTTSIGPSP